MISWSVHQLKKHDKGKLRWWALGLGFCSIFFALNMWFVYSSFSQDFRAIDFNDSAYTIREIIPVEKYKLLKKNKQGHLVKTDVADKADVVHAKLSDGSHILIHNDKPGSGYHHQHLMSEESFNNDKLPANVEIIRPLPKYRGYRGAVNSYVFVASTHRKKKAQQIAGPNVVTSTSQSVLPSDESTE